MASQEPGPRRRLTLLPLVAATYFMVSGGPYGLEELVAATGFRAALVVLLVTPLVWSLPTALMVGELAGAIPDEGGYYVWVRRALGPFAGFLEAWLSLAASVFDMAIYPTLFAAYLAQLWPALGGPGASLALGVGLVALCALWNVRGARAVGAGALVMSVVLLGPFVVLAAASLLGPPPSAAAAAAALPPSSAPRGLLLGLMVAMWNYMGWDNASTIAGEVERPQRTYPRAMILSVTLVAVTYLVPVAAVGALGLDPSGWRSGSWAQVATLVGGRWLGLAVVVGGVVCAVGMENALVLSYSRLPAALAEDGYLPRALARRDPRTGAPVVAIVACAALYTLALGLGFERLVTLDVMLYGLSLVLEFAALVVLRVREPHLPRPFRVPGGLVGAVALGVPPTALLVVALVEGGDARVGPISVVTLGLLVIGAAPLVYLVAQRAGRVQRSTR